MKHLSKISILFLLVALAFCACDKNNGDDDGGDVPPNPPQSWESIFNLTGKVVFVVDAPQIKEKNRARLGGKPTFRGKPKVPTCHKTRFWSFSNV